MLLGRKRAGKRVMLWRRSYFVCRTVRENFPEQAKFKQGWKRCGSASWLSRKREQQVQKPWVRAWLADLRNIKDTDGQDESVSKRWSSRKLEIARCTKPHSLTGHHKNFGLYPKYHVKPLVRFEQRSSVIWFLKSILGMRMSKGNGWVEAVRPARKLFAVNQMRDHGCSLDQDGSSGDWEN